MNAADPWIITTRERLKFEEQFKSLQPNNGIVTGAQAKGFLLQSHLPALTLGQIWALADTDADGKMKLSEFSIACKLINLKLRGFDVPKALPPTLIASLNAVGGTPILTPTSGLSPLDPHKTLLHSIPPAIPPQPAIIPHSIPHAIVPPMMGNQLPTLAQHLPQQPLISAPARPAIPPQPLIASLIQPVGSNPPMMSQQPLIAPIGIISNNIGMSNSLIEPMVSPPLMSAPIPISSMPAPPTPPSGAGTPNRSMSISERAPSIESPGQMEWAVKGPAKLKYTQLFNTTDRNRSGYLTGPQSRNILVQSKLPQAILAQIWALADMDSDGRLGCEEFVLAMYLCDMAMQGEKIPAVLPADLIPPSFRKPISRHGSIVVSRHNSVSSQGTPAHTVELDPLSGLPQTSFEDKRKENFDKGQAELERRRKALLDIQRKEQEERERKEREENDKREKARIEAEMKKQQELERELMRQRELEQEREEQRKRELEKKELARKEMEKQRQQEWEAQKVSEMQQHRQREQENVLKLKAHNQSLSVELSTFNEKIKELSQKICDTRVGVTNVKTVIDGMRTTRDTQMSDMAQLKAQVKDQNQRLVHLSQEKAKLDAKNKSHGGDSDTHIQFSNKQIIIQQLRDKLENSRQQVEAKSQDINANTEQLTDLKTQLTDLINACEDLYSEYDIQRIQIMEMKNNRKNETYTSAWDTANSWPAEEEVVEPAAVITPVAAVPTPTTVENVETPTGYVRYRAIFEFYARNADEITFQPGDFIMVPLEQNTEPGWLAGEINGHTGWFPETYVEKVDTASSTAVTPVVAPVSYAEPIIENTTKLEPIPDEVEVENTVPLTNNNETEAEIEAIEPPITATYNGDVEYYVSCYAYQSAEVGDLIFDAGEMVLVTKKEGDWWTGTIGSRTGIFPSNYVQKQDAVSTAIDTENNVYSEVAKDEEIINGNQPSYVEQEQTIKQTTQELAEEARNQAEADSEVSQINTQPPPAPTSNDENVRYSSMSTSATPSLRSKKGEVAQVIAPYEATSTEQLSLTRGQLIMIRKKTDSGWWEGELQAKGRRRQIGWFPATYVKVLQGGRNSGRNTPVSASKIELTETILDKVIALYPYKALNDDELSFDKDDIISVMGRDEPEWWRGELNGTTGLFPSNYVGPFVSSGKQKS